MSPEPIKSKPSKVPIVAISTEIGRGHPNYLDSVLKILNQKWCRPIPLYNVFELSRGASRYIWERVAVLYKFGSSGGTPTRIYNSIRSKKGENQLALNLLGRELLKYFSRFNGLCLVEHPMVGKILADVCPVYYIHGEIAAPLSSVVLGAKKIFVPLDYTKDKFIQHGISPARLSVTGLMIEPELTSEARHSFQQRLERISSKSPLTIGFFTSGAYPPLHMKKILAAVNSLKGSGYKAVIFAGTNKSKSYWFKRKLDETGLKIVQDLDDSAKTDKFDIKIVSRDHRLDETRRTCELLSTIDIFVAASHERTNWALGLGLPMLVLFPMIGSYAQENYLFARHNGMVYALDSDGKARRFAQLIEQLRNEGILANMAQQGFGRYRIDGVARAVADILMPEK